MIDALSRLLNFTAAYDNVVWISPGNPSSQRWFEAIAVARKSWIPWGPDQALPAKAPVRGQGRTLFIWNPMVHSACPAALRALRGELQPGDRVAFLLPDPASSSDSWRHELRENGFESLQVTALGRSPFLATLKLNLYLFRHSSPWTSRPSLSLVIPTRNEAGTIGSLLSRLTGLGSTDTEIIFVEGHSTDDTWGAIGRTLETYRGPWRLRALRQPGRGKWDAVQWGMNRAEGKVLGILDGNLRSPPETVRRFYEALIEGRGDVIVGDRFRLPMEPGAMATLPRLGNQVLAAVISRLIHQPLADALGGTKLLSAEDYRSLALWGKQRLGELDLFFGAAALNLKLCSIPISYKARIYGASHWRPIRDAGELMAALFQNSRRRFKQQKQV